MHVSLYTLYGGLDRAYGSFLPGGTNEATGKVEGVAQTVAGEYTAKLWQLHLEGVRGLGVVPITDNSTCNWGVIDVDVYPLDLTELEEKVKKLGLPLIIIRTKSGGAHLTLFLETYVSASVVRSKLTEFSVALGYGGVEIFPKQTKLANGRDTGNWLNMPYFQGLRTTRYAIVNGKALKVDEFVRYATAHRISEATLTDFNVKLTDTFADGPPCLQIMAMNGVPQGARNNALFAMGVYCMMKHGDSWEGELDALNRTVMIPPLPPKDVQMIGRSLNKKNYFYPCTKPPLSNLCNKDLCRKREFGVMNGDARDIGISLGDLVKVTTDPPIWFMDVDGVRIELDTEDLLSQERFRKLCVSAINKLPGMIKKVDYERLIREKLSNVQTQEAPVESGMKGRIAFFIEQFFNVTAPAKVKEEILLGKHWRDPDTGLIHFRGNDLLRYLDTQGMRVDSRKVWTLMSAMRASYSNLHVRGKAIAAWCVELEDSSTEPFALPDIPHGDTFDNE